MPKIYLIGTSHKTAPVEVREKLAFSLDQVEQALERLKAQPCVTEGLLFSTCNRTEIVYVSEESGSADKIIELIAAIKQFDGSHLKTFLYCHKNEDAVRHLFTVASSLDSMVVGEPQILGQIKQAYRIAVDHKTCGVMLNRLMHKSFSIAKKVRRHTGIGDNAVSISYAAVELAGKIFSDLSNKKVLLFGAGEMAELAVAHLISHRVASIRVANRTFERAVTLAEKFNGQAISFDERERALSEADIIISSTGATDYVLTRDQVKSAMKIRKNRPLFLIDIAVPRDIDPAVNRISNAFLYDIDDLSSIVTANLAQREKETVKAGRYVEEAVVKFMRWQDSLRVVPTIKAINEKISTITCEECEKTLAAMPHLPDADADAVRRMTKAIARKVMHDPIRFLKNTGNHRDDAVYLNMARQLFDVDLLDHED